ncbi:unannotated protein [freshwater metagenome]|uniref:Unannotated protein n=1 Tax=freshwater metagenome TaxID=449393 RepID=A0A6J7R8X2_9ZZZZ|nr:hypothetical protein [Actinomycetota bacterium]MSW35622.1 hypothetical protein [Actinomycetota bacterium]
MTESTEVPSAESTEGTSGAPVARMRLDIDLVPEQTSDDTDAGWGRDTLPEQDPAALLRRYLEDKPPHHGD